MFYGSHKANLEEYRKQNDVVKGVKIVVASDSCDVCKKLSNKQFTIDNVPELPYEKCTSSKGCRCSYSPVTIGWKQLGKRFGIDLSDLD